jgi:hypothetical protein
LTRCSSDTSEKRRMMRSLDEATLDAIIAAKKALESQQKAQRKLKASEYGRKQGSANRVLQDSEDLVAESSCSSSPSSSAAVEPQRCKFITAQTGTALPFCIACFR